MIHEETCKSHVKTIPGDLLPSADIETKETEESKANGKPSEAPKRPTTLQIEAPLITPE